MKNTFALIIAIAITTTTFAQNAVLSGKITNPTGEVVYLGFADKVELSNI